MTGCPPSDRTAAYLRKLFRSSLSCADPASTFILETTRQSAPTWNIFRRAAPRLNEAHKKQGKNRERAPSLRILQRPTPDDD